MIIFICVVIASSIFFAFKGYSIYSTKIIDIIFKRFPQRKEKRIFKKFKYRNSG